MERQSAIYEYIRKVKIKTHEISQYSIFFHQKIKISIFLTFIAIILFSGFREQDTLSQIFFLQIFLS